jgi:CRP/FNR family transcriptional regulator, anaerobic regulatory protein
MNELFDFLNSVYPLTKELRDHLAEILEYKEFKAGDYLVKAGRLCEHVYFITSGFLRSFYNNEKGKEMNVWFMKQGDVVYAERSFLDHIPSAISIQALRNTGAFFISRDELNNIYDVHITFNIHGRKLTEKYYKQSLEREEIMRMHRASDRYNYLLEHFSDLANMAADKDLATFLRMTPVTISRLRNQRRKKNLIQL